MNISSKNNDAGVQNVLNELQPDYDKAETDLLREALLRTHKERFLFATRLYKIQQMLGKAKITHKPV